MQYFGKIEIQKRPGLFRNPPRFVDCSIERSIRYNFFWLIWRAFNISSHLIIVWIYISRAVFPILIVHHFLHTNPYKMSIFQRSVTCRFSSGIVLTYWQETQAKKFDTFVVKIASKGTSLNQFKPILSDGIYQHDDAYQNQGSRKLDNLFCRKGSSVNYTNLRLLEYMLQSHESSWRFPTTLQTIPNLSLINLKRSSVEQLKTQ